MSSISVAHMDMTSCPAEGFVELRDFSLPLSTSALTFGVGDVTCPWKVIAAAHQVLNVSVLDFSVRMREDVWRARSPEVTMTCRSEVGYVTEGGRNVSLCSGDERQVVAFASTSNSIQITLTRSSEPHALVKITGAPELSSKCKRTLQFIKCCHLDLALGCPPVQAPANAQVRTTRKMAVVECNESDEAWYLTCAGSEWVGQVGNCSSGAKLKGTTPSTSH